LGGGRKKEKLVESEKNKKRREEEDLFIKLPPVVLLLRVWNRKKKRMGAQKETMSVNKKKPTTTKRKILKNHIRRYPSNTQIGKTRVGNVKTVPAETLNEGGESRRDIECTELKRIRNRRGLPRENVKAVWKDNPRARVK